MKRALLLPIFFLFLFSAADGQRCGSAMGVVFLDRSGKPLANDAAYRIKIKINDGDWTTEDDLTDNSTFLRLGKKFKHISFRTQCGVRLAEFEVARRNKKMLLKIRRIPEDVDFSIETPPFKEGVFEIDFENSYDLGESEEKKHVPAKDKTTEVYTVVSGRKWRKTG